MIVDLAEPADVFESYDPHERIAIGFRLVDRWIAGIGLDATLTQDDCEPTPQSA